MAHHAPRSIPLPTLHAPLIGQLGHATRRARADLKLGLLGKPNETPKSIGDSGNSHPLFDLLPNFSKVACGKTGVEYCFVVVGPDFSNVALRQFWRVIWVWNFH